MLYLDSQPAFDGFAATLRGATLLAIDTEAASFHRYRDRVYLVQLSTRTDTAVVDPLAVPDLSALGQLMADPAVEVLFHDADYDLRILDRDYGFHATHLFDTRVAAQLLNEPGIGLAALLEKYLSVKIDKKFQRADWSVRPLLPGMLEYAANDTRYLPTLRDIMQRRLEEMGRWSWAEEEFGLIEKMRWNVTGPAEEAYLRMKGVRTLRGHQLAVLRELFALREQIASEQDRAPFRVLMNEAMLAIAKAMPTDANALRELKALSPDQLRRRGDEILAAVARGAAAPRESLPVFERGKRVAPDLAYEARLERMKLERNVLAERVGLAPGVLCPNGHLEAVARLEPKSVAQLAEIPEMRRWQREVVGEALVRASLGKSA